MIINRKIGKASVGESVSSLANQHVTRVESDEGILNSVEDTASGQKTVSQEDDGSRSLYMIDSEGKTHEVSLDDEPQPLKLDLPDTQNQIDQWREEGK